MENRRVRKKKTNYILCLLHEIDFVNTENRLLGHWIIKSSQEDSGLACHEVREKVKEINPQINEKYLISVNGYYTGDVIIETIGVDDLTVSAVQKKIRGV